MCCDFRLNEVCEALDNVGNLLHYRIIEMQLNSVDTLKMLICFLKCQHGGALQLLVCKQQTTDILKRLRKTIKVVIWEPTSSPNTSEPTFKDLVNNARRTIKQTPLKIQSYRNYGFQENVFFCLLSNLSLFFFWLHNAFTAMRQTSSVLWKAFIQRWRLLIKNLEKITNCYNLALLPSQRFQKEKSF